LRLGRVIETTRSGRLQEAAAHFSVSNPHERLNCLFLRHQWAALCGEIVVAIIRARHQVTGSPNFDLSQ
jgi:hypothetical protein